MGNIGLAALPYSIMHIKYSSVPTLVNYAQLYNGFAENIVAETIFLCIRYLISKCIF